MTADFTAELQALLDEMEADGSNYYTTALLDYSDDIEHVATKVLSRRSWSILTLDIYRRIADGAVAGVRWDSPATEMQEGQERDPQVVEVEQVMQPTWRIKRSAA